MTNTRDDYDTRHRGCGGTISAESHAGHDYLYCSECLAFTYEVDGPFPTGTEREANRAAWDNAEDRSPDAEEYAFRRYR